MTSTTLVLLLSIGLIGVTFGCDITDQIGPCLMESAGDSCNNGAGKCETDPSGLNCCKSAAPVTLPPVVTKKAVAKTTAAPCADLLNPTTGVSDCPKRSSLCQDSNYYDVMTKQCPKTCGRCGSSSTNSTTCINKTNPSTGVSDCPSRKALCTNAAYKTVMTEQCPKTCGVCTSTATATTSSSSSSTCIDKTNPSTGVSDCPSRKALCTNAAYKTLMTEQCPKTCGTCTSSGTATTASSVT